MRLEDLNQACSKNGEGVRLAEEIDGRLIDGRLIFNQRDTAKLIGITPRAFSDWNIEPIRRKGRQVLYYWPDVSDERQKRIRNGRS